MIEGAMRLAQTERVTAVSAREFAERYRAPARPVVIETLTTEWPALHKWTLDYFAKVAGAKQVPLYGSKPARGRRHQHAPAKFLAFGEYLRRLADGESDLRMFFYRVSKELPELLPDFSFPDLGPRFHAPLSVLFMGGKGARVQMHFDIDLAEIVLCHFGGAKRVFLFAPEQTPHLYRVPFSFSALFDVDPASPDYERFPRLARAVGEVAELRHGDALYIPPGFWHAVVYDETGFSLSLRAWPNTPGRVLQAAYNIFVLRTADGLMRRVVGQRWNERNERIAAAESAAAAEQGEDLAPAGR